MTGKHHPFFAEALQQHGWSYLLLQGEPGRSVMAMDLFSRKTKLCILTLALIQADYYSVSISPSSPLWVPPCGEVSLCWYRCPLCSSYLC